ncbi:MAG: DUF481 domain-containing protein [Longimicrobiales bacterium]|nr:DUF481 domain-containing protein [Longimicrobiales bacterium]
MRYRATLVSALLIRSVAPSALFAQDAPPGFEWTNETELSFVSTSGNASSTTFGMKNSMGATMGLHEIEFEFGGVRASSETTTRRAIGTPTDFSIEETVNSETTAENYFVRGRYDRSFDRGFLFAASGWSRNTFAGIDNRVQLALGVGQTFAETDNARFKADFGLTYTYQDDVDVQEGADNNFGGWRISAEAMRSVSETTQLESDLVIDNNVEALEDLRMDWTNSLSVSINSSLALRTSFQLLWDNKPALIRVPLEAADGTPAGVSVFTPSDEMDTVVNVTLVIRL